EIEISLFGADAGGRDLLDPSSVKVDDRDVVTVECFVVVDAEHEPLAPDGVAAGRELLGYVGIVHGPADHLAEQLGAGLVGLEVHGHIAPGSCTPETELVEDGEALLHRRVEDLAFRGLRRPERPTEAGDPRERLALLAPELGRIRFEPRLEAFVDHAAEG